MNRTNSVISTARALTLVTILTLALLVPQRTNAKGETALGVFEGITPCSSTARPAPQIAAATECEMMIWHLTLYQDSDTNAPTTYSLRSHYGMSQPNTTGTRNDATPLDLDGTWTIIEGTQSNPTATVYQLNPDDPAASLYFVKLDDNVLHVLSPTKQLMVGNGAWSYTLNRTDEHKAPVSPAATAPQSAAPPTAIGTGSDVLGVFDGRMPCADLVYEFLKITPNAACIKIKMRLTLYQDPATGAPTTYTFQGTQTERDSTWSVTTGTAADPNAVVYQLQLDSPDRIAAFLKADDNNLLLLDAEKNLMVGDKLWSYTLSRVEKKP